MQCASNELTGDIVEVVADDLRLRANTQYIVADSLDQRGLPADATAPSVSHVWQAIRQNCEGSAPSSRST
jgi:hypothetical protein